MKRIKKLFALLLAATLAASLLAVPAMGAEPAGRGYTYYVMMKVCESGRAEYFVENEPLADALAALKIDGAPVFSVEKAADEGVWYITACDGDFTPTEVANALDGIKALAIGSGTLADNTLTLGYDALVLVKTRAGTCLVSEVTSDSQNLFERPAPADKNQPTTTDATIAITSIDGNMSIPTTGVISAEIGSTVTYTITVNVERGAQNVKLHHTLSDGLTLNTSNTTITPQINNTDILTWSEPATNQPAYTMTFPDPVAQNGGIYTITCTATVNENAEIAKGNTLSAHLSYGNSSNVSTTSEVSLYTFGFDLLLKNGADAPLSGAKFTLKNSADKYYTLPTDINNALEARFQTSETAPTIETDDDGKISFTGLAAGTYILTETTAAEGYEVPDNSSITITIGTDGKLTVTPSNAGVISNKANVTLDSGFSYNVLTLTRHANTSMPSTGGSGTVAFYLAGGTMMLTAAALFVFRRKNAA